MRVHEGNAAAVEFSLQNIEQVPHNFLNPLTQTRKTYQPEGLQELKDAIRALNQEDEPQYELFHPLMVNRLDDLDAAEYIADLNLCHGTEHTVDQLTRAGDGFFYIIIAGHRRHIATGSIIQDDELDPSTTVACSVYDNLSFRKALRKQLDENAHEQLTITETARAIQATYKFGIAKGEFKSIADCAKSMHYGEKKVRKALKFCELPEIVQDLVEEEHLSYSTALALYPMMQTLRIVHADLPPEDIEEIVYERMLEYALKAINNDWSSVQAAKYIDAYVKLHVHQGTFDLELQQEDAKAQARRDRKHEQKKLLSGGLSRIRAFVELSNAYDIHNEHNEAIADELVKTLATLGYTAVLVTQRESAQSQFDEVTSV